MQKSRTLVLMASMRSPTIGSPDQTLAPLSSGAREWGGLVGEHGSVDDVGEPAFEDAEGFHTAVAVVFAPVEQFTSWWVEPCLVNAMRCSAVLSCRFPLRDKRCRCLFDDHTGSGAVPL